MRKKNAGLSIIFSLGGLILITIIQMILRRIMLQVLGPSYIGLNGLFSNIISILSLTELGIGTAITFALYLPLAEKNYEQVIAIMQLFGRLYRLIALIVFVLGLLVMPFLPVLVKGGWTDKHIYLYFMLYVVNTVVSYLYAYRSILITADQKKYIVLAINNITAICRMFLQIAILLLFKSFLLYLLIQLAMTLLTNIITTLVAKRRYPYLMAEPVRLHENIKGTIKRNVSAMLLHQSSAVVVNSTDSVIIAKVLGLTQTGLYANYAMVVNTVTTLNGMITGAATASVGNYIIKESGEASKGLFYRIFYMNFWVTGFSATALLCLINPLMELWLGEDYVLSKTSVLLLVLTFYFKCMRGAAVTFRDAYGLYREDQYKAVIEMAVNLVASVLFVYKWGIEGVFAGTLLSTVATCFWMEPFILFKFGFKVRGLIGYFKRYAGYTLISALSAALLYWLCSLITGSLLTAFVSRLLLCAIIPNILFAAATCHLKEFRFYVTLITDAKEKLRNSKRGKPEKHEHEL